MSTDRGEQAPGGERVVGRCTSNLTARMGLTSKTSARKGQTSRSNNESLNALMASTAIRRPDKTSVAMSSPWELSGPTVRIRGS